MGQALHVTFGGRYKPDGTLMPQDAGVVHPRLEGLDTSTLIEAIVPADPSIAPLVIGEVTPEWVAAELARRRDDGEDESVPSNTPTEAKTLATVDLAPGTWTALED
jgi:hypothetical protein